MPGDKRPVIRFLDEEVRGPAQQIFSIQILDCIQDPLLADQVVEPAEKQLWTALSP